MPTTQQQYLITSELTSLGFSWDPERKKRVRAVELRVRNPFRYDLLPVRKQKKKAYDPVKSAEYKRRQRERWIALGIVKA